MKYKKRLLIIIAAFILSGCQKQEDPNSPLNLGMAAIEQQKYEEAIQKFEKSISDREDEVLAYRGMGMAYMGLGEYEKAIWALDEAVKMAGDQMENTVLDIRLYKAAAQLKAQDYEGVIATCSQILPENKNADAYYMRGTAFLYQGEENRAKTDYDKASSMLPDDYDLFWNIYENYKEQNLSAKGDEYLQKALNIGGEETDDYYQRGRIYYYLENYEKAKEQLLKPAEEKNQAAALLLGKVYLALEDPSHARSVYQQYLVNFGEKTEGYNGLALCDLAEDAPDAALGNIAKGLSLNTEEGKQDLYYNEIIAYERKKDFAAAKSKAQAYVENYPEDEAGKKEYDFLSTR